MSRSHDAQVAGQFGPQAAAYVASAVHAQGEDLAHIGALVRRVPGAALLDLGCGGGHVAYAAAPHAARVVAYDLSREMLAAVSAEAGRRGLGNVEIRQGAAERLPFAEGAFDIAATRYSAHHWRDVPAALAEMARVTKPGGLAVVVDLIAPEDPLLDTHLQAVELLRDPSHVRDYALSQWRTMLGAAGFAVGAARCHRIRLEFESWIARMRTPPEHVAAIRSLQDDAPEPVRRHFEIEPDGSFSADVALIEAARP